MALKISPLTAINQRFAFTKEQISKKRYNWTKGFIGINTKLAFKNMKRNRKRFYITVLSMTISIMLFVAFTSFLRMFDVFVDDVGTGARADFQLYNNIGYPLENVTELEEALNEVDGVSKVINRYPTVYAMGFFLKKTAGMIILKRITLRNFSLTMDRLTLENMLIFKSLRIGSLSSY